MLEQLPGTTRSRALSRWPRRRPVRWLRRGLVALILFPLTSVGYGVTARGREHFDAVSGPCLVISNHNMRLDQTMLLRAMPGRFRRRVSIAAAAADIYGNRLRGFGASLFGNAFPFATSGSGIKASLEDTKLMLGKDWHVLIFPEGRMTRVGTMAPFKAGIGLLAIETGAMVLPMRIDIDRPGIFEGKRFLFPRGRVTVSVGAPVRVPSGLSYAEAAALLEQAVRDA